VSFYSRFVKRCVASGWAVRLLYAEQVAAPPKKYPEREEEKGISLSSNSTA
jgi:hypothetical protein